MGFDWNTFVGNKNEEITRLNNVYLNSVLKNAGVEIMEASGKLAGPNAVEVHTTATGETTKVTAKNILIAVGGWPFKPDIPGIEHTITSNEIFYLNEHPKEEMTTNSDIDVQFNTDPQEIIKNDDGSLTVVTNSGNKIECDAVMYATGRKGKTDQLNLESAGVETKGSFIPVNEYSHTNVPSIYAVGDVTNRIALTPVALMEGHRLADTVFGGKDSPSDHEYVASTVFTTPEIGTVGYTEDQAAEKFSDVDVYKSRFRAMKHSFPKSET